MPDDPNLNRYGHPILPAGYNADDNNGDEVDGAGTNWAIWPELFVAYVGFKPLLLQQEDIDRISELCPDYVVPCVDDTLRLPAEFEVLHIRRRA